MSNNSMAQEAKNVAAGGLVHMLYGDKASKSGSLIGWAWGLSRIIDGLELCPEAGIDVRRIDEGSRSAFEALPAAALARGWAHIPQGGAGRLVRCCHTVVDEKHWLFPAAKGVRPIEIAFGPLRDCMGEPGCDLRPSHPALATPGAACCG
jgi:hypothetical protein